MKPKISVIMPSLNVVSYIRPCMESVLSQTLHDMEILAVDAGSDDGTLEILEEFALRDTRIKIICSDKKSYGYQLNMGIKMAAGDYVAVVETDDMIVSDMFETLYHVAVETDADYVKGRAAKFIKLPSGMEWKQPVGIPLADTNTIAKEIAPADMPELLVRDIYLWTGIYKSQFVRCVRLNETAGAAFQDQGFLFQTISSAQRAVYLNKVVYYYRQDNNNSSIFNQKGFHYLAEEYAYVEKFLDGKDSIWTNVFYQRLWNQMLGRFRTMAISGKYWETADIDIETLRDRLKGAVENRFLLSVDVGQEKWKLLNLLLDDAKSVFDYYLEKYQTKIKTIQEIWQTIEGHKVIVFGAGEYGRFFHMLLESRLPETVVAYCDNNMGLWNVEIQGIRVLSPEDAVREYPDEIYVIANKKYANEIREQLQDLNVPKAHTLCFQEKDLLLFHAEYDIKKACYK